MLRHRISRYPSTLEKLQKVATRYPINAHPNAVLGIGPQFIKPVEDDIPVDPDDACTGLNKVEEPPVTVRGEPILRHPEG